MLESGVGDEYLFKVCTRHIELYKAIVICVVTEISDAFEKLWKLDLVGILSDVDIGGTTTHDVEDTVVNMPQVVLLLSIIID